MEILSILISDLEVLNWNLFTWQVAPIQVVAANICRPFDCMTVHLNRLVEDLMSQTNNNPQKFKFSFSQKLWTWKLKRVIADIVPSWNFQRFERESAIQNFNWNCLLLVQVNRLSGSHRMLFTECYSLNATQHTISTESILVKSVKKFRL